VKSKTPNSRAISPARAAAFDILLRVERDGSFASELLHSRRHQRLTAVDHSLATEIVMGVLRWRSALDPEISAASSQPLVKLDLEVLTALRLGLYQLRWLDRIPPRAAINESVELVKRARKGSAAPFANAILRKLASANSTQIKAPAGTDNWPSSASIAASWAHPPWLVDRWQHAYGIETALAICRYDQSIPNTAIRLRDSQAEGQLAADRINIISGSLLASARIVRRGEIATSPIFQHGRCVIQDEASQLVAALVGQASSILDCCAAPGNKTLAIADRNSRANIAAVELYSHRARLLKKLLNGASGPERGRNVHVIAGDARNLPISANFERVLADVPCSGTGTLARNPEIKWRLKPEDLTDLQSRQLAILRSAIQHVAPGGCLIYSTCSLEKEENEDVIERTVAEDSSLRVLNCAIELDRLRQQGELIYSDSASLTRGPFLRTIPGIHSCDGFFAAILQKP
jgi:16S rRNA (cytosine967-C5)-methyltransferase